jgi:hypothetical protein
VPRYLRFIRKSQYFGDKWAELERERRPPSDLNPDRPSNEHLSFWELDDDRTRLRRIVAAFSELRAHPEHVDYVLFSAEFLRTLGRDFRPAPVETRDVRAGKQWHWELIDPTEDGRLDLARKIQQMVEVTGEAMRLTKSEVIACINESRDAKYFAHDSANEGEAPSPRE